MASRSTLASPLYTTDILRLAASLPDSVPLDRVDGASELRSATCGSTLSLIVKVDDQGRVEALSQQVHACAFGQASAALMQGGAVGLDTEYVSRALTELTEWLAGARDYPGRWPGLAALAPARSRKSRHGAILLPFRALAAALAAVR